MLDGLCYPEDVEAEMAQEEHFVIDPAWSIGRCFLELDKFRARQMCPDMTDAEREKIAPIIALMRPSAGASAFSPADGNGGMY